MTEHIELLQLVGEKAIEPDKGENIGNMIVEFIKNGNDVELDFSGITSILSLFLNPAIGDLYGHFSEETIKEKLKVANVPKEYLDTLKNVVDRAKSYYADPERKAKQIDEVINND